MKYTISFPFVLPVVILAMAILFLILSCGRIEIDEGKLIIEEVEKIEEDWGYMQ